MSPKTNSPSPAQRSVRAGARKANSYHYHFIIKQAEVEPHVCCSGLRFQKSIEALTKLSILPFDESAARLFENLKRQRLRCGTMDLKIASICLAHDALLLTRNLSDFEKVPGLRVAGVGPQVRPAFREQLELNLSLQRRSLPVLIVDRAPAD